MNEELKARVAVLQADVERLSRMVESLSRDLAKLTAVYHGTAYRTVDGERHLKEIVENYEWDIKHEYV